ncbi:hypothetical protein HAHE_20790 [Haloferula helveola]|uniref:Uncharacterized protein n=1 Tax=Haloferula helveola TaxID=490095 RepID=A0ABM7RE12_9BACT|nr:hypothetical protein HAHE_20790 [Haloferula helveola]
MTIDIAPMADAAARLAGDSGPKPSHMIASNPQNASATRSARWSEAVRPPADSSSSSIPVLYQENTGGLSV